MLRDKNAALQDVTTAVGILVTLIICVLIFYNIAATIDVDDLDSNFANAWPVENSTNSTLDQAYTFFSIAPIIVIVIVAVVILKYVGMV